jgi:adhesin transport system membrane fusion protein
LKTAMDEKTNGPAKSALANQPKSTMAIAPAGKLQKDDDLYIRDMSASLLAQDTAGTNLILYLMALLLVSALVWAHFATVEEVTTGQARVIALSREQIIQSLEGGLLEELAVREGDVVEKGQVLLRIDATRAGANFREGLSKIIGLKGTIARLRAEAFMTPLKFPPDVQAHPSVVNDETQAYNARKRTLDESTTGLRQSLALADKEIAIAMPLAAKGLYSDVELLRARRTANEIRLQMAERVNRYSAEANAELVRLQSELAQAEENITAREDMMTRTTIRAPVRGTVKNVRVTTIGGVIPQGADIMELVPLEDQLLVEAKIRPSDVAFLHPGLAAMVKVSAYDFSIYGGMTGTVEHISPDTLREDKRTPASPDESYYRVLVRTKASSLHAGGKELPIIPGMTATVDIRTGQKSVLDYLLKPVLKMREAFRER